MCFKFFAMLELKRLCFLRFTVKWLKINYVVKLFLHKKGIKLKLNIMTQIISLPENDRIAELKEIQKKIMKLLNGMSQKDLQYLSMSINCEIKNKSILIVED